MAALLPALPAQPPPGPAGNHPCTCPRRSTKSTLTTALQVAGGAALIGVTFPILTSAALAVALPAVGFTSAGIGAGSLAACVQSIVYGANTTGLFSALTSLGATIVAPAALEVTAAAGAVAAGGALIGDGLNDGRAACACTNCDCPQTCNCVCRRHARGEI